MNPSSSQHGFTLIEVVVALAIVALGMFAVFTSIGGTASNVGYLRDKSMAGWIADNRITEIRLSGEFPSVDRTEGDVDYAGRRWHWTAIVSQTPVDGLRRIDMMVRRDGDADDSALARLAGFVGSTATATGPSSTPWNNGALDQGPGDGDQGDEEDE
ncbi:MAG: type II secretion system minor pseudopilin GspI [Steroidobacteraceae bacterium]